jgi:hypothetical protein
MSRAFCSLLLCSLLVAACDSPFQVHRTIIAVEVAPYSAHLATGERTSFEATARNEHGARLSGDPAFHWTSSDTAVARISADGTVTARRPGTARITATLGGISGSATVTVAGALPAGCTTVVQLPVGGVATLGAGAGSVTCLAGGAQGAEYTLVHFYGSTIAGSAVELNVALRGDALSSTAVATASTPLSPRPAAAAPGADAHPDAHAWELGLRERESRVTEARMAALREQGSGSLARDGFAPLSVPVPGTRLRLNVNAERACSDPDYRTGEVAAVTDRAIVVADVANPAGGFTAAEYEAIGRSFDELVYPAVTRHFGSPSDVDGNGRVILFFTVAVNEMGGSSPIGGFFFSRDLLPNGSVASPLRCEGSNEAEILYLMVPDPSRAATRSWLAHQNVLRSTTARLAHEMQHLVNAAGRMLAAMPAPLEEPWLNEGLSHVAEEIVGNEIAGLGSRENVDYERIRSTPHLWETFNRYHLNNFGRLGTHLERPHSTSPIDAVSAAARGASWQFLRYAADRRGGDEAVFWRSLTRGPAVGLRNLEMAIGVEASTWLRDWSIAVFADDRFPGLNPIWQQPRWHVRSVLAGVWPERGFPLQPLPLSTDAPTRVVIAAGSAAYLGLGVGPGGTAEVRTGWNGGLEPPPDLLVSVVRTR